MQVEIVLNTGEQVMRAPFHEEAPRHNDILHIPVEEGIAIIKVLDRNWLFEKSANGVTSKMQIICAMIEIIRAKETEGDQELP